MSVTRNKQRQKANTGIRGVHTVDELVYNEAAGARKVLPLGGLLTPVGALGAAYNAGAGATVAVFNNTASPIFFAVGDAAVVAPTGPANGVPVPAYSYFYASLGANTHIIASSASGFGFLVSDDTYWA
jgi:hypothetical protein